MIMTAIDFNKELFEKYINGTEKPVLVDFGAPWCVYCRRIAPALNILAEQYQDLLTIGKINIDDEQELAVKEQIEVIPTLIIYKGGQPLASIVAPESKAQIEAFIKETLQL
jgi:thioredoxin